MGRIRLALSLLLAISSFVYYPGASLAQGPEPKPPPLQAPRPTPPSVPKPPDLSALEQGLPEPLPADGPEGSAQDIPCPGGTDWVIVGTQVITDSTTCNTITVNPGAVLKVAPGRGTITMTAEGSFVVSGTIQGIDGTPGSPPTNIELSSPSIAVSGKVIGANGANGASGTVNQSGKPTQNANATGQDGQNGASVSVLADTIIVRRTALIKAGSGGRGGNATAKAGPGDPTSHQVAGNATAVGATAATQASCGWSRLTGRTGSPSKAVPPRTWTWAAVETAATPWPWAWGPRPREATAEASSP